MCSARPTERREIHCAGMSYSCSYDTDDTVRTAWLGLFPEVKILMSYGKWRHHFALVPQMPFLHICIHAFSVFLCRAAPQSSENASSVGPSLLQIFAAIWVPTSIKTDNESVYSSKKFKKFFNKWNINHFIGIPYNHHSQGIIERATRTLKQQLLKKWKGCVMVVYPLIPALWRLSRWISVSYKLAWSIEWVSAQAGIYSETLSQQTNFSYLLSLFTLNLSDFAHGWYIL